MTNDKLQALIDLPTPYDSLPLNVHIGLSSANLMQLTVLGLKTIAKELLERRAFDAFCSSEISNGTKMVTWDQYDSRWEVIENANDDDNEAILGTGSTPFEAWQNAKKEGKL